MEVNKMEDKMEVKMEDKMEVNKMEVEMEVQMEVERNLNLMELNKMEVAYNLVDILGWKEEDYEKEDCELDLSDYGCD